MKAVYGVLGFVLGVIVLLIFQQNGVVVDLTRPALLKQLNGVVVNLIRPALKQNNRLEIEDGKHVIVITRELKAAPELSIDCDRISLTDLSGDTKLTYLPPNQEAIINFKVKNDGGTANNVEVYWSSSSFPEGLELTRQEPIVIGRSGSKSYKVKVIARNMGAQNIVLKFSHEETSVSSSPPHVCEFTLTVAE